MSKMRLAILLPLLAIPLAACGDDGSGNKYDVSVLFNQTVEQEDIGEVGDLLRGFSVGFIEIALIESFPPQLRATLETHVPDFCATVRLELEGRSYVREVTCGEHQETPLDGGTTRSPLRPCQDNGDMPEACTIRVLLRFDSRGGLTEQRAEAVAEEVRALRRAGTGAQSPDRRSEDWHLLIGARCGEPYLGPLPSLLQWPSEHAQG